jgi:hypothetical protein
MKHFESEYLSNCSTHKQDTSFGFCGGHVFRLKGKKRIKTKTKYKKEFDNLHFCNSEKINLKNSIERKHLVRLSEI